MESYERARIAALVEQDDELRLLWHEHLDLERRLEKLDGRAHLTPEEELERKQVQKLKLAGKDRIAELLAKHDA
jgi:uncharacterized protein YdcH (DUF465 family)